VTGVRRQGASDGKWLVLIFLIDAVGVSFVAVAAVLREASERQGGGFLSNPLPAAFSMLGLLAVLGAGVVAATRLVRFPLMGPVGRRVSRSLVAALVVVPVFAAVEALRRAFGLWGGSGWMQFAAASWVALAGATVGLAALDRPERSRALLVAPVLFAWAFFAFWLGDMIFPD